MSEYRIIGLMSGTSLDGLDIAFCKFQNKNGVWNYDIEVADTVEYDSNWKNNLIRANELSAEAFLLLHNSYGEYIGDEINKFIKKHDLKPDIIASHGHTIFHQPEKKFTFQIGNGASIFAKTNITTIYDFRTLDVALGGQGAPLVPIGDKLLFSDYNYCLNLGGFGNISFEEDNKQIAFDTCPCNMAINYMVNKIDLEMDRGGEIGSKGTINQSLLEQLNAIEYYSQPYPKSLGKEWFDNVFMPILESNNLTLADTLRTIYEHIAQQISKTINQKKGKVLVTGGGAFNSFLIDLLKEKSTSEIVLPSKNLINFKEALIFALLGLLRFLDKKNCLASVTGASSDCSGGIIHRV